jgi:hypothetical protein
VSQPDPTGDRSEFVITHPNREKAVVQSTRAIVVFLLLASAALVLIVTIGGWSVLEGDIVVDIAFVAIYLTLAFYAARWNRGVLPVGAALAVLLAIFAGAAAPGWFNRDGFGYAQPTISANLLGILTLIIIPLQLLLVYFAMRGLQQGWNVELERPTSSAAGSGVGEAPAHPA